MNIRLPLLLSLASASASATSSFSPLLSSAAPAPLLLQQQRPHILRPTWDGSIIHGFVPELQAAAVAPSAADAFVNVTSHLGANNPSIQFDGVNYHYHFARGDAGWISAFETANRLHIHRIYFPRGVYWFGGGGGGGGQNATVVDISLYPNLFTGTALDIEGAGDYLTSFTTWAPVWRGPMLTLTASTKSVATMSWKLHGMHFDACSASYALAINTPDVAQPRVEHNNLNVYDLSLYNHLDNNTCHGKAFPLDVAAGQTAAQANARGAFYAAHIWSSAINVGLGTVATGRGLDLFNDTAGVCLNEVQYSTLSLRGLGTHSDASFGVPDPTRASWYNGWGLILKANVNSNTIVQLHCEGSGGCVLIDGPGSFENLFTSAVMSMIQRVLVASHDPPPEPMSVANYNRFAGIVVNRYPVVNATTKETHRFSKLVEGRADTLLVEHMSVIGDD
eukprot:g2479.t1